MGQPERPACTCVRARASVYVSVTGQPDGENNVESLGGSKRVTHASDDNFTVRTSTVNALHDNILLRRACTVSIIIPYSNTACTFIIIIIITRGEKRREYIVTSTGENPHASVVACDRARTSCPVRTLRKPYALCLRRTRGNRMAVVNAYRLHRVDNNWSRETTKTKRHNRRTVPSGTIRWTIDYNDEIVI